MFWYLVVIFYTFVYYVFCAGACTSFCAYVCAVAICAIAVCAFGFVKFNVEYIDSFTGVFCMFGNCTNFPDLFNWEYTTDCFVKFDTGVCTCVCAGPGAGVYS